MPKKKPGFSSVSFSRLPYGALLVIFVALAIESGFEAVIPLSLRRLIDFYLDSHNRAGVFLVLSILTAAAALTIAVGFCRDFLSARLQSKTLAALRQRTFSRMQRVSMAFHAGPRAEGLLDYFSEDFGIIENTLSLALPWGVLPVMEALLSSALLFYLEWEIGAVAMVLWVWVILAPRLTHKKVTQASAVRVEDEQVVLGAFRENLASQAVIRAFSLEETKSSKFARKNEILSRSMMRAGLLAAFQERFTEAGILLIQVAVLGLSVRLVWNRDISIGTLVAAQMLVLTLANALLFFVEFIPSISAARAASRRIEEAISAPDGVADRPDARHLPPFQTEIIFSHVSLTLDSHHHCVSDLKARIPRGARVAFVGSSGSGKSSALGLLMRLHDPSSGFVAIDGHDLRAVTQASLRSRIGTVLQDNTLFNFSLLENIRVGKPESSVEDVRKAAARAGLNELIARLPKGDATIPSEYPFTLADVQRIAIARALLREPEILLLDEATSALDHPDELAIGETLREIAHGRTVISATHRLSTVADSDHIFVFEMGNIVEQGSHFELMAMQGTYADLWRRQTGFTFSADGSHVDVDAERLRQFPILENLDQEKLTELAPYFATETFQPGREIVRQNDPGDKFYIIARGKVEVWRAEEGTGYTRRVAVLHDGDFFGEITLITGFPRTATVRAMTACTCISLGRGQFNRMLEKFPELQRHMSDVALKRLRESSKALTAAASLTI